MIAKYKQLILSLLLCGCAGTSWGQTPQIDKNYVLSSPETTAKSYTARDYVKLQANGTSGFSFQAATGKSFSAKIDPGLLFPPTDKTYAVTASDGTISYNSTIGAVVGSIPGQLGVSPTGGATYNIPIECPTGINGVQPNISLVYNSQGGNGTVGVGWQITGLSAVGRTTKNIFSDNAISGLDLSIREKYTLDGNNLILNSADKAYGADGTLYKTENKTYSLIQSIGSNSVLVDPVNTTNTTTCTYPLSFKVTTKDGQVVEYGNNNYDRIIPIVYKQVGSRGTPPTLYSSQPFQWLISKVTDANGNFMIYSYMNEAGVMPTVKKISYGNLSIQFDYEEKTVVSKSYINGYYLQDKYLLRHIRVVSNGTTTTETTIKQYDLSYDYNNVKGKYYLKTIALVGLDNVKLNNTKIEWGTDKDYGPVVSTSVPYPTYLISGSTNQQIVSTDIDGDGYSDLVHLYKDSHNQNRLNIYKNMMKNNLYRFADTIYNSLLLPSSFEQCGGKRLNGGLLFCDFNGDGKKTILSPTYEEYKSPDLNYHNVEFYQLDSHGIASKAFKHSLQSFTGLSVCTSGDFNNDGIDEVISIEKGSYGTYPGASAKIFYIKKKYFNNGYYGDMIDPDLDLIKADVIYFSPLIYTSGRNFISGKPKDVFVADFNSDGLNDLMVTTEIGCFFLKNNGGVMGDDGIVHISFTQMDDNIIVDINSTSTKIKVGDFNGDGLVDFIVNMNDAWKVGINNGRWGFDWTPLKDTNGLNIISEADCIVTDFNRDGKSDIIIQNKLYHEEQDPNDPYNPWAKILVFDELDISWYVSTGTAFNLSKIDVSNDESLYFCTNSCNGDFDGDGREDILNYPPTFSGANDISLYGTFDKNITDFNSNFEANLVKSITDGMGVNTKIAYQPITYAKTTSGNDFYSNGTGSVYPIADITAPINCVQRVSVPIDNTNNSVTEYSYTGARVHATGKGFLGFTGQSYSNASQNQKVESCTELELPYCLPKTQTVLKSALAEGYETASGNFNITKSINSFINTKSSDGIYISQLSKTEETDYLNDITKITNYTKYDTNGNLTDITTTTGDLTTIQVIEYNQFGSWAWCANKPISSITTKKIKNDPEVYIRKKTYDYNAISGNLIEEVSDPTDTKNKVTTTYSSFDTWGHPQTVSVATPGKTTRSSQVKYTSSGRFIDYKINHLGEKTKYDWGNEVNGQLSSETDYQDYVTSYTYNGLGQLSETQYANGIRKANILQWASSGNTFGAKYYSYSETSGSAPVWIWYDAFGREIVKQTYGLGAKTINVFTKYLSDGKVDRVSEPTFVASVNQVATNTWAAIYNYDDPYGRVRSVTTPLGKTSTDYSAIDRATVVSTPSTITLTYLNNYGKVSSTETNGKAVSYTYYPSGLTKTSTPQYGKPITMYYDLQGNRTKLEDPDAGTVETTFNGFGELTEEKQIVHNYKQQVKTTNNYLDNGLIDNIVRENIENFDTQTPTVLHSETTSYIYDTEPKHTTRVKTIKIDDTKKQTFGYDNWDRVTSVDETVGTKVFNHKTEYDFFGRVKKEVYPTGYYTLNTYDNYSYLTEVKDNQRSIWLAVDENAKGQLLHENKGGKVTSYEYYNNGLPKEIKADGVIDMYYEFETLLNLHSREDKLTSQKEVFGYDDLNRLTSWKVTRAGAETPYSMTYDDLEANVYGNIIKKSGIETSPENQLTMSYGGNRPAPDNSAIGPHALATIGGIPSNPFPSADLTVTYTDFKKIETLSEGTGIAKKDYNLTYGVDEQRRKSEYYVNNALQLTRYYLGNYEEEVGAENKVRRIHYLSGAILIQEDGKEDKFYYTYSDYQGSLIALTDVNGLPIRKYAYDPWGVRRDAENWNLKDDCTNLIVNRGYTGHEHLDAFGIINMNGRVYDPYTAMFFNPDPYVQAPGNWVNYNRYLYAYGNPFKYTDPSGEFFFYLMPNIGWDASGGLTIGLTAGFGLPGFGVSASFSYGLQSHDWSVSAGIGAGGVSAYVGYSSSGGMIAGYGFNLFGMGGGLSSNMTGFGVNWSQNGGFSANMFGMQMSGNGVSFNPSISASYTFESYRDEYKTGQISTAEYKQLLKNAAEYNSNEYVDDYDNMLKTRVKSTFNGFEEGDADVSVITTKTNDYGRTHLGEYVNSNGEIIGGYSSKTLFGKSEIHISSSTMSSDNVTFKATTGHEIIHAVHRSMVQSFNKAISERVAYEYTATVYSNAGRLISAYSALNTVHTDFPSAFWSGVPSNYSLTLNRFVSY